jgi:hypothetical protein
LHLLVRGPERVLAAFRNFIKHYPVGSDPLKKRRLKKRRLKKRRLGGGEISQYVMPTTSLHLNITTSLHFGNLLFVSMTAMGVLRGV